MNIFPKLMFVRHVHYFVCLCMGKELGFRLNYRYIFVCLISNTKFEAGSVCCRMDLPALSGLCEIA